MKTHLKHLFAALFLAATLLTPFDVHAGARKEPPSFAVFWEGEEYPKLPVVIITFPDLPAGKEKLIEDWKTKITEKVRKLTITEDKDYGQVYEALEEFYLQFKTNGATILRLEFPRRSLTAWILFERAPGKK